MIDITSVNIPEFSDKSVSLNVKCDYCSADHESKDCFILVEPQVISDSKIPTRAKLTLPPHLKVVNMSDGTTNVIANVLLPRGVRFGPYQARKVKLAIPSITFPLKIFKEKETDSEYYLDTTDQNFCNWMCFVAPANNLTEQNVICYQLEIEIYYSLIRDVNVGETLKVWYAPNYGAKMGKELLNNDICTGKEDNFFSEIEISQDKKRDTVEYSPQVWNCNFCHKIGMNTAMYAKHLKQHYKDANLSSNKCSVCGKQFFSAQALHKHTKKIHHLEFAQIISEQTLNSSDNSVSKQLTVDEDTSNDYDDTSEAMRNILEKFKAGESIKTICSLSDVRSENKNESDKKNNCERTVKTSICSVSDSLVGGQINEQLENTSLLVSSSSIDNMNLNTLSYSDDLNNSVLIDNDINKFNIFSKISDVKFNLDKDSDIGDNLIEQKIHKINEERSVADFNLDFVENNDLDITNIYTKKNCNDIDGLNATIVNTQNEPENDKQKTIHIEGPPYKCDICDKKFNLIEYLIRHLKKHSGEFVCGKCLCIFGRKETLMAHICKEATTYNCSFCNKTFPEKKLLKRHSEQHFTNVETNQNSETTPKNNLCCVCQKTFKNNRSLTEHIRIFHDKRRSVCEICGEVFKEIGSLKIHKQTHLNRTFTCDFCGKVFKKRSLYSKHKLTHEEPQIECTVCHKKVKTTYALSVHMLLHTNEKKYACSECNKQFIQKKNFLYHINNYHNNNKNLTARKDANDLVSCPICDKKIKKSWLQKHRLTVHSNDRFSCCYCDNVFKHPVSIKRHLLATHKDKQAEWDNAGFIWNLYSKSNAAFQAQESNVLNIDQEQNQQICFPDVQHFTDANEFDISAKIDFINDSEMPNEISNQASNCVELFSDVAMELDTVDGNLSSKGRPDIQILNNLKINQEQISFEPMLSTDNADVIDIQSLIGLPNSDDGLITFNSGIDFDKSPTKADFALQMDDSLKDKDIFAPIQISDGYMNVDQESNLVLGQNAFLLGDETVIEQQEEGNILFYVLDT